MKGSTRKVGLVRWILLSLSDLVSLSRKDKLAITLCDACKWEAKMAVGAAKHEATLEGMLVFNGAAKQYALKVHLCAMHWHFYEMYPGARAILGARAGLEAAREK